MKTNEDKDLCEEIIWWAKFLTAHGVNPRFILDREYIDNDFDEDEE